jgi:hypothetical protein
VVAIECHCAIIGKSWLCADGTTLRGAAQAGVLSAWTDCARGRPVSRRNALRQLWAAARYHAPASRPPCPVLLPAGAAERLAGT